VHSIHRQKVISSVEFYFSFLRFKVLMEVSITIAIFCDVTPLVWYIGTNISKEPATSIIYPEDDESRFPQNFGTYLPNYMASHPRKP
jgi:hypothetical protein